MTDSILQRVAWDLADEGHDTNEVDALLTQVEAVLKNHRKQLFAQRLQTLVRDGEEAMATEFCNMVVDVLEDELVLADEYEISEEELINVVAMRVESELHLVVSSVIEHYEQAIHETQLSAQDAMIGEWEALA